MHLIFPRKVLFFQLKNSEKFEFKFILRIIDNFPEGKINIEPRLKTVYTALYEFGDFIL